MSLDHRQLQELQHYLDRLALDAEWESELLDHLSCCVEHKMSAGRSFQQAWQETRSIWTPQKCKDMQRDISRAQRPTPYLLLALLVGFALVLAIAVGRQWFWPPSAHAPRVALAQQQEQPDRPGRSQQPQFGGMDFGLTLIQDDRNWYHPVGSPLRNVDLKDAKSSFGPRIHPITGAENMHEGIDLLAPLHTPVYATAPGYVSFAGRDGKYGITVRITHTDGYETVYCHLNELNVQLHERIDRGNQIGRVGTTGASTRPHLHYEIRLHGKPLAPC